MVTFRDVEYRADGRSMIGRLAVPEGEGRRPGVLIAHEGNGLDDFQRERADRLAELGYVAFALDYHGGGEVITEHSAMLARLGELGQDPERIRALGRAGLGQLLAEPSVDPERVAAIGYCFGGTVALELARSGAALAAVVGFHPGLTSVRPADSANIRGRVLICTGADDPFTTLEQRNAFEEEMRAAGVSWDMFLFGGVVHSFTHPRAEEVGLRGLAYDRRAADRAWQAMLELFAETLGAA